MHLTGWLSKITSLHISYELSKHYFWLFLYFRIHNIHYRSQPVTLRMQNWSLIHTDKHLTRNNFCSRWAVSCMDAVEQQLVTCMPYVWKGDTMTCWFPVSRLPVPSFRCARAVQTKRSTQCVLDVIHYTFLAVSYQYSYLYLHWWNRLKMRDIKVHKVANLVSLGCGIFNYFWPCQMNRRLAAHRLEKKYKSFKLSLHWFSVVRMQAYNYGKESDFCPELSLALDYCDRRDFVFDVPPMLFPSLKLKFQHGCNEAIETEQTKPPHRLTTNCSLMLAESTFVYTEPAPINTIAPPILPEPQKRPVGRPRLHPKKYVDPNRVKRGKIKQLVHSYVCTCFLTFISHLYHFFSSSGEGRQTTGSAPYKTSPASRG